MVANIVAVILALIWVAGLTVVLGSPNFAPDINAFGSLFTAAEGK